MDKTRIKLASGRSKAGHRLVRASSVAKPVGMVVLRLRFWKEGHHWLGECLELGTATFADTLDQAQTELLEMIDLHLNTLEGMGARAEFFNKFKIRLYKTDDQMPATVNSRIPVQRPNVNQLGPIAYAIPVTA